MRENLNSFRDQFGKNLKLQDKFLNSLSTFLSTLDTSHKLNDNSFRLILRALITVYESTKFIVQLLITGLIFFLLFVILKLFNLTFLINIFYSIISLIFIFYICYGVTILKKFISLRSDRTAQKIDEFLQKENIKLPL